MSTLTITPPFFVPEGLLRAVISAYAHPPRAYHSFTHVQEVLKHFEAVRAGPGWHHPNEVFLAILFHDAVYVAGRKDNEAKSAELAVNAIATFLRTPAIDAERVSTLITLTAKHGSLTPTDVDRDAALFLDSDMAILGAAPDVFAAYDAAIATEYAGLLTSPLYRIGRRRFLSKLLATPRIYLSDFFHDRLDAAARANLRHALGDE